MNCEFQRSCQGPGAINQAVVTCYHTSCTTIQRGQPLRMCQACHVVNHEGLQDDRHIYQGWSHLRRSQCSETQQAVLHTVEPLYRGHLGTQRLSCTVEPLYRGHHWTQWLSCIQWNLSIEDTLGPAVSCIQWNLSIEDTIGPSCCPVYSGTSL